MAQAPWALVLQSPVISRRAFDLVVTAGTNLLRVLLLNYFDITFRGKENLPVRGPAIIAGNHPCYIDGLLLYLMSPVPLQFVAHRELFRHPLMSWVMKGLGFINAEHRGEALRSAERALERGEVVVIFPEGGPYECGRMEELHAGVALLALHSGAPVYPLGIAGSAEAYPLGAFIPYPGSMTFALGRPIHYEKCRHDPIPDEELFHVLVTLRNEIQEQEAVARRVHDPPPRPLVRLAKITLSAILLLPIIGVLTALAHDLQKPPP